MTTTTTLPVDGMTCEHCVRAVVGELSEVPGVTSVTVDLVAGATSQVTVHSDGPLDRAAVLAAVAEAGYTVAPEPGEHPPPASDG